MSENLKESIQRNMSDGNMTGNMSGRKLPPCEKPSFRTLSSFFNIVAKKQIKIQNQNVNIGNNSDLIEAQVPQLSTSNCFTGLQKVNVKQQYLNEKLYKEDGHQPEHCFPINSTANTRENLKADEDWQTTVITENF